MTIDRDVWGALGAQAEELTLSPPCITREQRERLASFATAKAECGTPWPPPSLLAERLGVAVHVRELPDGRAILSLDDRVVVAPHEDERIFGFRVLCALAMTILGHTGVPYTVGDAVFLALELAAPRSLLDTWGADLVALRSTHLPVGLVQEWARWSESPRGEWLMSQAAGDAS